MKKIYKIILLIIFNSVFLVFNCFSQNPLVKQWDKRFGGPDNDFLTCFQETADGGYILGGYSESDTGGDKTGPNWNSTGVTPDDYWIIKIDSAGNKQWDKDFGGTLEDQMFAVQQTSDGGYILGGVSNSGVSGDKTQPSWGYSDYWMLRTDAFGNKLWDMRFGGTGDDWLRSVQQTSDAGFILGGYTYSGISGDKTQANWDTTLQSSDYWIVKIDLNGIKQWDRRFGGTSSDDLGSVQQTFDGGYILGGYSVSDSSGDKTQPSWGIGDYWVIKIDSLGNKEWDKRFGGDRDEYLYSLIQCSDQGFILGGRSRSGINGDKTQPLCGAFNVPDYWIVKIDSVGNKQWDKECGAVDVEDEFGNISQTADNGYLVAGTSYSNISCEKSENNLGAEQSWIIKTDYLGNEQWDKTLLTDIGTSAINHDEIGLAIQTKDQCYAMVNCTVADSGGNKTQLSRGGKDYWIIKFCDTTLTAIPNFQFPASNFQFSPNPLTTQSKLTFKNTNKEKFLFTLYDITGRVTETVSTTNNEIILTKGNKPAGVYLFNLVNEKTGERWNGKIVISD